MSDLRERREYNHKDPLVQALEKAYKEWADGNCHELGCGCITVHMFDAVLPFLAAARKAGIEEAAKKCEQDGYEETGPWFAEIIRALAEPSSKPPAKSSVEAKKGESNEQSK